MSSLKQVIAAKKTALARAIESPLSHLAEGIAPYWSDVDKLDLALTTQKNSVPYCHLLYALDVNGKQVSSNINNESVDSSLREQDLSERPFFSTALPYKGMLLSRAYVSDHSLRSCITAIHAVTEDENLLGFLAADFDINVLPLDGSAANPSNQWQQFRGDPAVRRTLFMQERVPSLMDQHLNVVNILVDNLMTTHGVFHCKLHYASGRCSLWLYDDPYHYRIHRVEEIIDPELCLAYPLCDYPKQAIVKPAQILVVLEQLKELRFADETIYLRSASLNIMNGMVGLTFSCDGSHYISVEEFLSKEKRFWFGGTS